MPTASASASDDAKAAEWYKLAADRGDREAMFALAMFRLQGRAGPRDREASAKLLAAAAKLGHAVGRLRSGAALYRRPAVSAGFRPRRRTAARRRAGRQSGSPIRARHALQGGPRRAQGHERGGAAVRRWPRSPTIPTPRSSTAIALFNGNGVAKDEQAAAALFRKAALHGSAIAQDRLARILAERPRRAGQSGRGDQVAPDLQGRAAKPTSRSTISSTSSTPTAAPPARRRRSRGSTRSSRALAVVIATADRRLPLRGRLMKYRPPGLADPQAANRTASPHAPLRAPQRHDQGRAPRRAQPQARSRRGREPAGLAEGAAQFRHRRRSPRRGDRAARSSPRRGRTTAFSARKAARAPAPTKPIAGSSIRSTAPPISCTAFRTSPSRSRSSATA